MLCRLEKTKDWREVLVVDELNKFLGVISLGVFHKHCLEREETLEIDEYTYRILKKESSLTYSREMNFGTIIG